MSGNNRQPVDVFSAPVAGMVQTGSGTNEYARLDRGSRNTVLALMGYDSPDDTSPDRVGRSVLKRERREVDQVRKRRPDRPEYEAVTSDPSPTHCQQIPADICTEILHGTIDRIQQQLWVHPPDGAIEQSLVLSFLRRHYGWRWPGGGPRY